jgi:hypothetical protein
MPAAEKSNQAFATTSSSCKTPIAAKTGAVWPELTVGRVLCATMQSEHEAASVWLGCWWVDSAAAVHNIRDRHSQADHLIQERTVFPASGLDAFELTTVI